MKKIFQWMNLRMSSRVLVVFIAGISQATGAQVAFNLSDPPFSPVADKAKPRQQAGDTTNIQHCETAAKEAAQLSPHGSHTVTLSWQASMPAKDDPVKCYVVYRGVDSFDEKAAVPIGVAYAPQTTLVDLRVDSGSYFYAVKAVSQHEQQSKFSEVLPVQVR
jgi:hypothetical protein